MITFKFNEISEYLGTRQLGLEIRTQLLPLLSKDKVVLDFTGVKIVAHSFADECLAKLMLFMPVEELKRKSTFKGLSQPNKNIVMLAFAQRAQQMTLAKNTNPTTSTDMENKNS